MAVAASYRASGRTLPLFDTVGHNPYPFTPGEPPAATHDVYVGQGDIARLVGTLDLAFAGTAQPPTPIWYLEDGFQTAVTNPRRTLYAGQESVTGVVTAPDQASQLATALRLAYCQPRVEAFFNFLLVDEPRSDAGSPDCSGPTGDGSPPSPPTVRRSPRYVPEPLPARPPP